MISGKPVLGRLEKVDLRDYWQREDTEFTPWLTVEENISLLGDTIGMELEVEAREKAVGPFSADILCKDTATDNWVLIENQLERTDHGHLGQLLTYAAGLNAVTIVWIAARFTDEHRAALDWLNEITDERINFFGLEIELWRIGASAIAPKFNIISKPNDWTKSGTGSGASGTLVSRELSEIKKLQIEFWQAFRTHLEENGSILKPTKPLPQNWMNIAIGRSGIVLNAIASTWNSEFNSSEIHELRAELVMHDKHAKAYFRLLEPYRSEAELVFGEPMNWYNPMGAQVCRIGVRRNVDIANRSDWPEQHEWLREKLERLHHVFSTRVRTLDPAIAFQEQNIE